MVALNFIVVLHNEKQNNSPSCPGVRNRLTKPKPQEENVNAYVNRVLSHELTTHK
jgi:hypothetical protein